MMMRRLLGRLFGTSRRKRFSAWQIELTTRCPLRCKMCVRDAAPQWHAGDMSLHDFRKLVPCLPSVETVVLEGWGEPLIYRDLTTVVRLVKEAGCRAGFVTSGWGLDEDRISELIKAGVDFMGFSLAGAAPETHNVIRANSNLYQVLRAIQSLQEFKARKRLEAPKLHLVFLMLRENIGELPLLVDYARDLRIDEIAVIHPILVGNAWQEAQRLFSCGAEEKQPFLREAAAKARAAKIRLRMAPLSSSEVGVCAEDPLRNLYISVDGNVSPCVFLYPPVPSPFQNIYCGAAQSVAKVSFGNIFQEPFENIWNSAPYTAFRNAFQERRERFAKKYPAFPGDPELTGKAPEITLPPPPEPCRTCHKMLGF